jgi:hypothetical protein
MRRSTARAAILHASVAIALSALAATAAIAQNAAFDLAGPALSVSVSRAGATLPLSAVPGLAVGDRLAVHMAAPTDRGSRYAVVLAFLRGATSPPPADWLFEARPWDPKRAKLEAAVPAGAEQAVILLVPETGGALKAVEGALRGRPGAFVRSVQELTQASLDRARLDAYLAAARAQDASGTASTADTNAALARSLAVKVDPACLARQPDVQAACLAQGGGTAVLADAQTSSLAQNLAGAPADVALAVSSTPQASFGYYSPYIGLVRDLARIFGAFQSAQLQFIPALEIQRGEQTRLFLNTPPSFRRPQSVLVAPLPAVAAAPPPAMTPTGDGSLCATRAPLLAGFSGSPLLYATDYARDIQLRVKLGGGETLDLPATADPVRGGYVIDAGADAAKLAHATEGTVHGRWGFDAFEGPRYALVSPVGAPWQVADRASLVVGRDSPLPLLGGAAACLRAVTLDRDGERKPVSWTAVGVHGVTLKVPLDGAEPGSATLLLDSYGDGDPQRLSVRAYSEPSRLSLFTIHVGEPTATLTGSRLDQVASLDLNGVTWRPDLLGRSRSTDRLDMVATAPPGTAIHADDGQQARVTLSDGRTAAVKVAVAPARPAPTLLSRSVERDGPVPAVPIRIANPDILPANMRLVFSIRAPQGSSFAAGDQVEVAAGDRGAAARLPLRLQDASVAIADLVPAAVLGSAGYGPARFRLVKDGLPGEWRPLGTVARLPVIRAVSCGEADGRCTLNGTSLYLLRSIVPAGSPGEATPIQDGFTGDTVQIARSPARRWRVELRDAPAADASIALGR